MADIEITAGATDTDIANWLLERLESALTLDPGGIAVSIPGGSTPFPILAELVKAPLDWSRIAVWPGDDRIVEESHPASNVGRIRALLEPAGARIVPLAEGASPPHFALVWLGMGEDGHVASLFPNTDPRADDPLRLRRITPDPLPPEAPVARVTISRQGIVTARALMIAVTGAAKKQVIENAIAAGAGSPYPIGRVLADAELPVDIHWAP